MAQLEIRITDTAKKYITQNIGAVQLMETRDSRLGWCRINIGPSVRLGAPSPKDIDRYNHLTIDGIEVYLPKSLFIPGNFTISLQRFFWFKFLTIDNWKLV